MQPRDGHAEVLLLRTHPGDFQSPPALLPMQKSSTLRLFGRVQIPQKNSYGQELESQRGESGAFLCLYSQENSLAYDISAYEPLGQSRTQRLREPLPVASQRETSAFDSQLGRYNIAL